MIDYVIYVDVDVAIQTKIPTRRKMAIVVAMKVKA